MPSFSLRIDFIQKIVACLTPTNHCKIQCLHKISIYLLLKLSICTKVQCLHVFKKTLMALPTSTPDTEIKNQTMKISFNLIYWYCYWNYFIYWNYYLWYLIFLLIGWLMIIDKHYFSLGLGLIQEDRTCLTLTSYCKIQYMYKIKVSTYIQYLLLKFSNCYDNSVSAHIQENVNDSPNFTGKKLMFTARD